MGTGHAGKAKSGGRNAVVVGIPSIAFGEYDPGNSTGSFVVRSQATSPEIGTPSIRGTRAWSFGQYRDGSKATRELGYRPEVSVDEAIRRAFEWFRSQG
jgi:nucleoside-diphosphate-sugar epimerase